MADKPIADFDQRREALDPARSFIVQAPAGSGKTELLIQRYLTLLARVEAPEEIAAITCTRKAAGEMRERVLEALRKAHAEPRPEQPHAALTWDLASAAVKRDAERRWRIATNPARLRIQTIDALCASLTRQMPVLSRFGAVPAVVEDAEALYREAARATLALLDEDSPLSADVARLLTHLDNSFGTAEALLVTMFRRRDQWIRHLPQPHEALPREILEAGLARLRQDALVRVAGLVPRELEAEILGLAEFAASRLAEAGSDSPILACAGLIAVPAAAENALSAWLGLTELLLTVDGTWRKKFETGQGFPPRNAARDKAGREALKAAKERAAGLIARLTTRDAFRQALHDLRALPPAAYSDVQWEALGAIARLLPVAVAMLKVTFQSHGQVDFPEVAQAAVQALGGEDEPTDLALALDYRIHHLLVDEFQDTSLSQFRLLERLTAGWQPGDGRTLFAVGDPMQSIYRFREAEVGLFLGARHRGIGAVTLDPLTLSVNFRSEQGIVDWVNEAFPRVMPPEENIGSGAVPYSPSVAHHPRGDGVAVTVHPFFEADRRAEAARVVELVRGAQARDPQGTVAILVRGRGHLIEIVPQLKEAGLRLRAIEIELLGERPAVQDLLALTRALAHLADRIAWLAVLRAPWCGLTLEDLERLAGVLSPSPQPSPLKGEGAKPSVLKEEEIPPFPVKEEGAGITPVSSMEKTRELASSSSMEGAPQESPSPLRGEGWGGGETSYTCTIWSLMHDPDRLARLSEDGRERLLRVREVLEKSLAERRRGPLRNRVEGAWLALGGPACVEDKTDLEDAEVFLDYLEQQERGGDIADFLALEEGLKKLYALPDVHVDEKLQVMTIHKAKGLEFDTVIVPGLGYRPARREIRLLMWMERPRNGEMADLLLAPVKEAGAEDDPIYRFLARLDAEKESHENARLLYVAATRARKRLDLLGHMKAKFDQGAWRLKAPAAGSLLTRLWPAVEQEFARGARALPAPGTAWVSPEPARTSVVAHQEIRRLASGWVLPDWPQAVAWQGQDQALHPEEVEFSWVGETARHVGNVVHRWLQGIGAEGMAGWDRARVDGLRPVFRAELAGSGVAQDELEGAVKRVAVALIQTLEDGRGRWLLGGPHAESRCELRLTGVLDGKLLDVAIDRTFVDPKGVRWIVDYKTSIHEGGDPEGFLDRERERYAAQLARYAELMGRLDERPLRLGLYFPLLRGWREWG